jgi:hypothetical protein
VALTAGCGAGRKNPQAWNADRGVAEAIVSGFIDAFRLAAALWETIGDW